MTSPPLVALALGCLCACGSSSVVPADGPLGGGADAPAAKPDAPVPQPDAPRLEDLPVTEEVHVAGLAAPVDVVRDTRGYLHIYGQNTTDLVRVQGYVMARDRFPQMEFVRRVALGRLSEIFGATARSMDVDSRYAGYAREGRAIYAGLRADDPTKAIADAFVAGVNQYVLEIKNAADKTPYIPRGAELLSVLYNSTAFGPWDPSDVFTLGRVLETSLSFDTTEIQWSKALAGVEAAFPKNAADARLAKRSGAFADIYSWVQGRRVYTRDGFPQKPSAAARAPAAAPMSLPSRAALDAAASFFENHDRVVSIVGGKQAGSNNWMVHGSHTASGHPLLANDPHLQLSTPPIWWYVHLNTKRGGGNLNTMGVTFAGVPGVVLGFNDDLAWGATVTAFDVTDVYDETLSADGTAVMFKGNAVPIQTIDETITVGPTDQTIHIQWVPHHGYIVPGTTMNGHALSVRFIGSDPSNELAFFNGLLTARTVDEARAAQAAYKVGSQNFIVASKDGDISWSTLSRVPVRDPRALDLAIGADGTVTGHCPTFVLPGDGNYEWIGDLDPRFIPNDKNPTKGFIATANQDSVGVTDDNNPCNNDHYLGGFFDAGYREGRIAQRLTALILRGNVTADDMVALQAESQSSLGDTLRDPIVDSLTHVIDAGPNDLFTADQITDLTLVRDRLRPWSRATPAGVGATDPATVADSIATTIFNVGITRVIPRAFGDEAAAVGVNPGSDRAAVLLERALTMPSGLVTYDDSIHDTVLWDDITTDHVETRDEIVARGFLDALTFLRGKLGTDPDAWRWGALHTVTFETLIPTIGTDLLSVPPANDPMFPGGYPRHSDYGAPDVGNFSLWGATNFSYGHGPSQRLVVELSPDGPHARNALPGGQVFDPASPHHADEAQHWFVNEQPPVFYTDSEVFSHAETHLRFSAP